MAEDSSNDPGLRVVSVSCGSSHSLALLSNGTVVSWGRGEDGQLGHGDAEECARPKAIFTLQDCHCSAVFCGAEYSVAHSAARDEVYSWGWGDFGRLGHGTCTDVFIPKPIKALTGARVTRVACGDTHTLVSTAAGELFAFGRNQNGQLGLGTNEDSLLPRRVEALQGQHVTSIACGAEHTVASVDSGEMYAWGWGRYGNLGDGARADRWTPTQVAALDGTHVATVACGWRHSACVDAAGAVYTFGWSKYGQCGHGDLSDQLVPRAVERLAGQRVLRIAGGWRHTVAGDDAGNLYAWGWNKFGQLGVGSKEDVAVPQRVEALAGVEVAALACGWRHTLVVAADGRVFAWGRGVNGQLGLGQLQDMLTPALVEALTKGTMRPEALTAAGPTSTYVAASDRYAVVPDPSGPGPATPANGAAEVPVFQHPKRHRGDPP